MAPQTAHPDSVLVGPAPFEPVQTAPLPTPPLYAPLSSAQLASAQLADVQSLPKLAGRDFVVGPENRGLARLVERLLAGAADPASVAGLHPVLLVGPTGVGKTDLARRIADAWRATREPGAVLTLTASDLRRGLADAARAQDAAAFREQLAAAQLLVIDDVPRLAVSESAQHELCGLIDTMQQRGGLLIGAASGHLAYCQGIVSRLRSRFCAGLTVEIAPLGIDARMALLQLGAREGGRTLTATAARLLADRLPPDPRRLLAAAQELARSPGGVAANVVDRAAAEAYAANCLQGEPELGDIVRTVARYYKVPLKLLTSGVRRQSVVMPRAVAIYLARRLTSLSYQRIGAGLGGRDHSTVMHNFKRVERAVAKDPRLAAAVADLTRLLSCV